VEADARLESPRRAAAFCGLIASTRSKQRWRSWSVSTAPDIHSHACSLRGLCWMARESRSRAPALSPAFSAAMPSASSVADSSLCKDGCIGVLYSKHSCSQFSLPHPSLKAVH
jgi:hypothetical protein